MTMAHGFRTAPSATLLRPLERFNDRDAWLAARGIGGSDVAAILGLSPFATAWDVWIRFQPDVDTMSPETQSQRDGRRMERLILDDFARQNPSMRVEPHEHALFRHHEFPWATCSPDGLVFDPERGTGLIEAKTSSKPDEWVDGVPPYYLTQVYWSLEVSGLQFCYVLAWVVRWGMPELQVFLVERNTPLQRNTLLKVAGWRLEHIVRGKEPPLDGSRAVRTYYDRRAPGKKGELRDATDREAELVAELEVAKQMAGEAERRKRLAEAQLSALWGDKLYGVKLPGYRCLRVVSKGRPNVDLDLVRAKLPEALTEGKPFTKFLINPTKERA